MNAGAPGPGPTPDLILPGGQVDQEAVRKAWEESDADDPIRVRFELQRDRGSRLDKYLTQRIGFMSRTQVQRLIDEGAAFVNGVASRASTKLRIGDVVDILLPPPPGKHIRPEEMALDVLFEDAHLIVLNKRPDVIVHPARGELMGTLINGLAWHFEHRSGGSLSGVGEEFARPGVVHRLDRDTTGCIVFAKDDEAHWKLGRQFEHRKVDKRYLAVVQGRVEPDEQVIDFPIGPHQSRAKGYREKQVVRHDELGKNAITICRVRERYRLHGRSVGDQDFSLVELELKTGRTHQIRVHLSHLGWPIVGDTMYGGRVFQGAGGEVLAARQMLHAALLAFEHPITGEAASFAAPSPEDMRGLIEHLRGASVEAVVVEQTVPLERFGLERSGGGS
ncbi:MAG: RluA family pseudouridine synthase [Phycisphaerales bacterium]|nr:RluA family pseudouridine synthase [Phycisphaerales bacterium]